MKFWLIIVHIDLTSELINIGICCYSHRPYWILLLKRVKIYLCSILTYFWVSTIRKDRYSVSYRDDLLARAMTILTMIHSFRHVFSTLNALYNIDTRAGVIVFIWGACVLRYSEPSRTGCVIVFSFYEHIARIMHWDSDRNRPSYVRGEVQVGGYHVEFLDKLIVARYLLVSCDVVIEYWELHYDRYNSLHTEDVEALYDNSILLDSPLYF